MPALGFVVVNGFSIWFLYDRKVTTELYSASNNIGCVRAHRSRRGGGGSDLERR
jgi:hypothetical protein